MRRKITSIIAIICLVAISIGFTFLNSDNIRYHQHLMAQSHQNCSHSTDDFCTHIPLIKIDTSSQQIPAFEDGKIFIESDISIFDKEDYNNHLYDQPDIQSTILIRARGNSSLFFDKKSYFIKLINDDHSENKQKVLGMDNHDEWVLHGPILDKTLIRNYISMNLSGQIMKTAPDVRFCEVFINDQYMGLYVMMESISRAEGRVDIAKYNENDPFTSYIIRLDRGSDPEEEITLFSGYTYNSDSIANIVYPPKHYLNEQLNKYISDNISQFEKALYSYDYDDPKLGYRKHIDVMSFVDYLIVNEFTQNYDAGIYSTYLFRDIKGKLEIGPVWDFNNAYDNYIETPLNATGFSFQNKVWYIMLMKDEYFVNLVIQRYKQLRKTVLSEEYVIGYIEDTVEYLGTAIDRNFEVWGYTFLADRGMLLPKDRNHKSYEAALNQLKQFIIDRGNWMDDNIDSLMQFCHDSRNKSFND